MNAGIRAIIDLISMRTARDVSSCFVTTGFIVRLGFADGFEEGDGLVGSSRKNSIISRCSGKGKKPTNTKVRGGNRPQMGRNRHPSERKPAGIDWECWGYDDLPTRSMISMGGGECAYGQALTPVIL